VLARINNNENSTIWFNNVPLVAYQNPSANALVDVTRDQVQACVNTQNIGSNLFYFGINYQFLDQRHLDLLVKNNVMYLIQDDFDISYLYSLPSRINALAIFNYSDLMSDFSKDYLFVILPQNLNHLQSQIRTLLEIRHQNLDLTFISDQESINIIGDFLAHYHRNDHQFIESSFGNVNVSMLGLENRSHDLDYANFLISQSQIQQIPALSEKFK